MKKLILTLAALTLTTGLAGAQTTWDSSVPYSRKHWSPRQQTQEEYNKIDWGSDVPYSRKNWSPKKDSSQMNKTTLNWGSDVPYSSKDRKNKRQENAGR